MERCIILSLDEDLVGALQAAILARPDDVTPGSIVIRATACPDRILWDVGLLFIREQLGFHGHVNIRFLGS